MTTVKMQRPSGGCQNCGGALRTYKPNGVGWVCSECARRLFRPDGGWPGHPVRSTWDAAVAAAGAEVARTWRLYMSAARHGFETGELEVAQMVLARPAPDGPAPHPLRP